MNCPACKVVVPNGYTRCPRCQHALPVTQRVATSFGGTALEDRRFPIVPIAIGALVTIAIIAFFATRGGSKPDDAVLATPSPPVAVPAASAPAPRAQVAPAPMMAAPSVAPSATAAGDELLKSLRRQRLWSTVDARVPSIDIRSQSCADPAMGAAIDAARPALRGAGLTALRCLEESGRVVFQRDL